mmetsp:Transcript_36803/g.35525  ORF Transcript_36803/g.35525 Transcript_36803/m.35525 type:complete len:121 (+) Transcript_36803:489-851(+)
MTFRSLLGALHLPLVHIVVDRGERRLDLTEQDPPVVREVRSAIAFSLEVPCLNILGGLFLFLLGSVIGFVLGRDALGVDVILMGASNLADHSLVLGPFPDLKVNLLLLRSVPLVQILTRI